MLPDVEAELNRAQRIDREYGSQSRTRLALSFQHRGRVLLGPLGTPTNILVAPSAALSSVEETSNIPTCGITECFQRNRARKRNADTQYSNQSTNGKQETADETINSNHFSPFVTSLRHGEARYNPPQKVRNTEKT